MAPPADFDFSMPPYAYVPGGPWPHPTRSKEGHLKEPTLRAEPPIGEGPDDWTRSGSFRRGFALFNAGYYWEAHEAWEELWHAHGRIGSTADLLRGLIKLAAAGVKVRERQPGGVVTHAGRAALHFAAVRNLGDRRRLGLDLCELERVSLQIAEQPPCDPGGREAAVTRVFPFRIEPRRSADPGPCVTPVADPAPRGEGTNFSGEHLPN